MRPEPAADPGALTGAIERSLGRWSSATARLVETLRGHDLELEQLESSIRGGATRPLSGRRMMVERVASRGARDLLAVLGVDAAGDEASRALALAERHGLPSIVGWDASGPELMVKLYVNASDASARIREAVRVELAPEARRCPPSPHVLGFNFVGTDAHLKAYAQMSALDGAAPAALREWSAGLDCSGVVRSVDVRNGAATDRAWFVSPRPTARVEEALPRLPGWTEAAASWLAPFDPGHVTSVGFSADGTTWTVYFKPRSAAAPSYALDPDVCLKGSGAELGVYLEPLEIARRAYARTRSSAVSYRVREGAPDGESVERVMAWVVERVREGERTGLPIDFSHPPEPWRVVGSR